MPSSRLTMPGCRYRDREHPALFIHFENTRVDKSLARDFATLCPPPPPPPRHPGPDWRSQCGSSQDMMLMRQDPDSATQFGSDTSLEARAVSTSLGFPAVMALSEPGASRATQHLDLITHLCDFLLRAYVPYILQALQGIKFWE